MGLNSIFEVSDGFELLVLTQEKPNYLFLTYNEIKGCNYCFAVFLVF